MPKTDDDGYDPREQRECKKPISNFGAMLHLVKGVIGTGFLCLPEAVKNAGLLAGTIGIVILGIIQTYCCHILLNCHYLLGKKHKIPFLQMRESTALAIMEGPAYVRRFAKFFAILLDFSLLFNSFGVLCVYALFVASNIKRIADDYIKEMDLRLWILLIMPPVIAIMLIRNLKNLVYISQISNFVYFVGIGIIVYFAFCDGMPDVGSKTLINKDILLFLGQAGFAYNAIGIVVVLEGQMKNPNDFVGPLGVLNQSYGCIIAFYAFWGFILYAKYGDELKQGSVTLNLPDHNWLAVSVNAVFALGVLLSIPLQSYIFVDILMSIYLKEYFDRTQRPILMEYVLRMTMIILGFLCALSIPHLHLFISLVGTIVCGVSGILVPGLQDFCLRWEDESSAGRTAYLVRDVMLFILGVLISTLGFVYTLIEIVMVLSGHKE